MGFGKTLRNLGLATVVVGEMVVGAGDVNGTDRINFNVYSDNIPGSQLVIRHNNTSSEGFDFGLDKEWSNDPLKDNRPPQWMRISTSPVINDPFYVDFRNNISFTPYNAIIESIGGPFIANNANVQFELVSGPDTQRPEYNYVLRMGSNLESGKVFDGMQVNPDTNLLTKYTGSFTFDSTKTNYLIVSPQLIDIAIGSGENVLANYINANTLTLGSNSTLTTSRIIADTVSIGAGGRLILRRPATSSSASDYGAGSGNLYSESEKLGSGSANGSGVPESGTLELLVMAGIAGAGVAAWKRKRKNI